MFSLQVNIFSYLMPDFQLTKYSDSQKMWTIYFHKLTVSSWKVVQFLPTHYIVSYNC